MARGECSEAQQARTASATSSTPRTRENALVLPGRRRAERCPRSPPMIAPPRADRRAASSPRRARRAGRRGPGGSRSPAAPRRDRPARRRAARGPGHDSGAVRVERDDEAVRHRQTRAEQRAECAGLAPAGLRDGVHEGYDHPALPFNNNVDNVLLILHRWSHATQAGRRARRTRRSRPSAPRAGRAASVSAAWAPDALDARPWRPAPAPPSAVDLAHFALWRCRRPGPGGPPERARAPARRTRRGRRARSRPAVHGPQRRTDLGADGRSDGVQLPAGLPAALQPADRHDRAPTR